MRHQIKKAAMALMVTGALVGGGTAVAHAASASPSAKASTSTSSAKTSTSKTADPKCPNK